MTVGMAVPITVASRAARNMPVMMPMVTAQRRREDIASAGVELYSAILSDSAIHR
jgi:hypothetical protein